MAISVKKGSAVLDRFWKWCRPIQLKNGPRGVSIAGDCRFPSRRTTDLLQRLAQDFGGKRVEAAGLGKLVGERWVSSRFLKRQDNVLVALRDSPRRAPFEVLAPSGGLVGGQLPLTAVLRDYRTRKWLSKKSPQLFVCGLTRQMPVMWALGVPATPMNGLLQLNASQLRGLAKTLGWDDGSSSLGTGPIRLVLVNCKRLMVGTNESPKIRQLSQFLATVDESLGIDMSRAGVWTPAEHELAKIQFCFEREDLGAAREAVLESLDLSTYSVIAYLDPAFDPRRKPENYVEALADLGQVPARFETFLDEEHQRRTRAAYEDFIDRELVDPVLVQAAKSGDPLRRNLWITAAESFRLIHQQTPSLHRDMAALAEQPLAGDYQEKVFDQLKRREQQVANVVHLVKALWK